MFVVVAVGGIRFGGFKNPSLAPISLVTIPPSTCQFFEPLDRRLRPRLHLVGAPGRECPSIVGRTRSSIDKVGLR
jgi:hypothetical protein